MTFSCKKWTFQLLSTLTFCPDSQTLKAFFSESSFHWSVIMSSMKLPYLENAKSNFKNIYTKIELKEQPFRKKSKSILNFWPKWCLLMCWVTYLSNKFYMNYFNPCIYLNHIACHVVLWWKYIWQIRDLDSAQLAKVRKIKQLPAYSQNMHGYWKPEHLYFCTILWLLPTDEIYTTDRWIQYTWPYCMRPNQVLIFPYTHFFLNIYWKNI